MTKVLIIAIFLITSPVLRAQTVSAQLPDGTKLEDEEFLGKTHFALSSGGARTQEPAMSFQYYTLSLSKQIIKRQVVDASLLIIRGDLEGNSFSEFGNPHMGLGARVVKLQEYHPLWLSTYVAADFANRGDDVRVASTYNTYTGALILSKYFESVIFTTEARYLSKTNEAVDGLDVGDEAQGQASLDVRVGQDWTVTGGWLFRRAAPSYHFGNKITNEGFYGAAVLGVSYELTEDLLLGLKVEVPTTPESQYRKDIASFGSLKDQATLGRSWGISLDMEL